TDERGGRRMQVGIMAPQGWKGEYDGWDPAAAWARTVELATQAEELGFESLWVFDHFHTVPEPTDEITLESFSVLSALAMATGRATYEGRHAHVRNAINVPKGIQKPRIPIIVGGNGEKRTAGYAVKFADELNYVFLDASEIVERRDSVRQRCEEEGRDPTTLR